MQSVKLVLETGDIYTGSIFAEGDLGCGELIFNTAMCGYEEVLTDPSYNEQFVLMTYPLIGNYGITEANTQSDQLHLNGLIVHEYIPFHSNWQATYSLKEYLEANNTVGIEGIDTRHLTRKLRYKGALNALVSCSDESDDHLIEKVRAYDGITGKNLAQNVSTKERYIFHDAGDKALHVAVIDCGVKTSILRQLVAVGCSVTVLPYNSTAETVLAGGFDGVLLSNGPGDPRPVTETMTLIRDLLGKIPLFGICLGHQLLCCATGFEMTKLTFGHHGINHPIKNMATGLVEISSQNHIYCATQDNIPDHFGISHVTMYLEP